MDPITPGRRTVAAQLRAVLAWTGALASPLLLYVVISDGAGGGSFDLVPWLSMRHLLPALALALPFALLRRWPFVALGLLLVGSAAATVAINTEEVAYLTDMRYLQIIAVDLAVAVITASRSRPVSSAVAFVALLGQVAMGYGNGTSVPVFEFEVPTLAMALTWTVGNSVRARRRHAQAIGVQAASQAATEERLRIARELHDMVAHSIGVIAIQAGMGRRVIDTQPAEARNALQAIEDTSRETLAGLRRVLVGLRQDTGIAPAAPAPVLADLDRLAATTAGAGVRVTVDWRGDRRPLPGDIELSAYRVVQEAVTNVVRHAATPRCAVTVEYRDAELLLEVADDGRGGARPGTGYGITGMRERVALLGGQLTAGPRPEGGWLVSARLPVPEHVAATVAA
ncbi:two-component sensor histidine kinase [Catellatospora methionotrophica]|uniref:histidine kinase n=1 Tax=Catellatospora methionotrophica TaxID=121620 RepID=A0A8J3PIA7_9ACTN|nr:sensor histidine kinase [Catellatospora methionotrophica]GIG18721.1 two-component sensor histidine kinase [Catellatospora methionotrophica]